MTENNNYILLEKYRKKLSVYFALFILFSLWITQSIFLLSTYFASNLDLQNKFETKLNGVVNILENKQTYTERINNNDTTLEKVVEKSLEDVTISQKGKLILGNIDNIKILENKSHLTSQNYSFFKKLINVNNENFEIIIKLENLNSFYNLSLDLLKFMLISLIFLIFFYFVGYFFVGRNFRPIRETIASLEAFSANINHEMKTPLAEIISTLSLTKQTKTNYEQAINQSLQSSKKLNKILDSMLGIINLINSSYRREKIDLIQEIKYIIKNNSKKIIEKNIEIKTDFKNRFYYQKINREYFDICVGNILSNAIKYSHNNSIIKVKFNAGVLEIQDYGIGIDEKNLKNIFNRFFREDYNNKKGLGIGLSLVKKIADLHNWKVELESKKNKGTKVKISFL